jgi:hypothetical protein
MSESLSAATDVSEFISDLDGGIFERKLSIALSSVAAAVCDNARQGKVTVEFSVVAIPGTSQVHIKHTLKFSRPTMDGEATEKESRSTPMHVGKYGKLSLAPENQLQIFGKEPA